MEQRTIPNMFEESVKKYPANTLMWEKKKEKYEPLTYSEMKTLVYKFAAGFMKLGFFRLLHCPEFFIRSSEPVKELVFDETNFINMEIYLYVNNKIRIRI